MSPGERPAVCVYCGSSAGGDSQYSNAAQELGRALAIGGFQLVYGGSSVGLMRTLADAALQSGGHVVGVRPNFLFPNEAPHSGLTALYEVSTMHERKYMMYSLSDAFVALPGGLGTLDELFEMVSWAQLEIHNKPIIVVNIAGFWTPLLDLITHAHRSGFVSVRDAGLIRCVNTPAEAIGMLAGIFGKH